MESALACPGYPCAEQAQRSGVGGIDRHLGRRGSVRRHTLRGEARGGGEAVLAREIAEGHWVADEAHAATMRQ